MNKIKLIEAEEIIVDDIISTEIETPAENDLIQDETSPEMISFIDSNEIEELRDILLDIPDDIQILLLNDDVIVLAEELENEISLLTLPEGEEDFIKIKIPMTIDLIKQEDSIIKYTPEEIYKDHSKVIDILMSKMSTPVEKEEETEVIEDEEEEETNE